MRKTILITLILVVNCVLAQTKLEIRKLTDKFYIYTTYQNYKGTMYPANGMYVITEEGALLIDSPWDTAQCQPLLDSITSKHGVKSIFCIATHSHDDRTGGLEYYTSKDLKTYTTKMTDSICEINKEKRAKNLIYGDTIFAFGDIKMKVIYAGPAHTKDNIFIWFEKEKILYGGCAIKSTEATDLGNLKDANLLEWPKTLKKIKKKCKKMKYVIPGHQGWQNKSSLDHTLRMLKKHNADKL